MEWWLCGRKKDHGDRMVIVSIVTVTGIDIIKLYLNKVGKK